MAVIETSELTKYYGKHRGIINVSISVDEGEIFGFIGPNGAGKSTMIKMLLNMIFPTSGRAAIFGMDCTTESYIIKKMTGYVPNEINCYKDLTVKQLLRYSDSFFKSAGEAETDDLMGQFELEPKKKIRELSSGNKKKVAIVAALANCPKLLILDEPTNGLDPLMRQVLFDALHKQQQLGCTVFLSSHNLDEVQSLCERVAIIREGKIADIRKLQEMAGRCGKKVTLRGGKLPDIRERNEISLVSKTEDTLVFTYTSGDMNKLLSMLSIMDLNDFSVEDIKLSDLFLSYYR